MNQKSLIYENSWVVFSLICVSSVFVTAVGYYDEGNHLIFPHFGSYLFNGTPPLSDYILWGFIFVLFGTMLFHLQSIIPQLKKAFVVRLVIAAGAMPLLLLALLSILA